MRSNLGLLSVPQSYLSVLDTMYTKHIVSSIPNATIYVSSFCGRQTSLQQVYTRFVGKPEPSLASFHVVKDFFDRVALAEKGVRC